MRDCPAILKKFGGFPFKSIVLLFSVLLFTQTQASTVLSDYRDDLVCVGELSFLTHLFDKEKQFFQLKETGSGSLDGVVFASIDRVTPADDSFLKWRTKGGYIQPVDRGIFVATMGGLYYFDLNPLKAYMSENELTPVLFLDIPGKPKPLHVIYNKGMIAVNGYVNRQDVEKLRAGDSKEIDGKGALILALNRGAELVLKPSEASFADFDASLVLSKMDELRKIKEIYSTAKDSVSALAARLFAMKSDSDAKSILNRCKESAQPKVLAAINELLEIL